jgi:hypothetical protein
MSAINLIPKTEELALLKSYLESCASDILADKINNGVRIEKDGKTLINKKDFATFLDYACEEFRKQADKGAKYAFIHHHTVFSLAIHYFEENEIIGKLYNEDGTEHEPPRLVATYKPTAYTPVARLAKEPSLFDIFDAPGDDMEAQAVQELNDNDDNDEELCDEESCDEDTEVETIQAVTAQKEVIVKETTEPAVIKNTATINEPRTTIHDKEVLESEETTNALFNLFSGLLVMR